ncbi:hypothetical protein [Erwinia phage FBB1]|nr:hypothetical protein [Erwinia phage FBB1]
MKIHKLFQYIVSTHQEFLEERGNRRWARHERLDLLNSVMNKIKNDFSLNEAQHDIIKKKLMFSRYAESYLSGCVCSNTSKPEFKDAVKEYRNIYTQSFSVASELSQVLIKSGAIRLLSILKTVKVIGKKKESDNTQFYTGNSIQTLSVNQSSDYNFFTQARLLYKNLFNIGASLFEGEIFRSNNEVVFFRNHSSMFERNTSNKDINVKVTVIERHKDVLSIAYDVRYNFIPTNDHERRKVKRIIQNQISGIRTALLRIPHVSNIQEDAMFVVENNSKGPWSRGISFDIDISPLKEETTVNEPVEIQSESNRSKAEDYINDKIIALRDQAQSLEKQKSDIENKIAEITYQHKVLVEAFKLL